MQRERLTPDRIRRFNCPEGAKQGFLWDTDAPRLAVRATSGAKSYIFESKLHRQTIRQTIGDVRAWNLDDARAEARRLQTLVDQGIDPRQERADKLVALEVQREEAKRIEAPALVAWADYIEARRSKWGARTLADHQSMVSEGGKPKTRGRKKGEGDTTQPGILRALLSRPLERIDADPLPTEVEFVTSLDSGRSSAKVPVLELTEQQLKQLPAPVKAPEQKPLPPLPSSYPPLEPVAR